MLGVMVVGTGSGLLGGWLGQQSALIMMLHSSTQSVNKQHDDHMYIRPYGWIGQSYLTNPSNPGQTRGNK